MQLSLGNDTHVLEVGAGDLRAAILATIAYADVFDYPPTIDEVHRYLIGSQAGREQILAALDSMDGKEVGLNGRYCFLPGRHKLVGLRLRRVAQADFHWRLALKYGRRLAALPFVRMVAVTGALAANNVEPDADLDYLIVTRPGYLWVTRALILLIDGATNASQARICPNFIISEDHLALEDRDLFAAQELVRMVPIAGADVYAAMRAQNRWTEAFLPNAQGAPRDVKARIRIQGPAKRASETLLATPPTRWLEGWEMRRKIAKFTRQEKMNAETRFSADFCKGHFDGHKQRTLVAFQDRLQAIQLKAS